MDQPAAIVIAVIISGSALIAAAFVKAKTPPTKGSQTVHWRGYVAGTYLFAGMLLVVGMMSLRVSFLLYLSFMIASLSVGIFGHYLNERLFPRE